VKACVLNAVVKWISILSMVEILSSLLSTETGCPGWGCRVFFIHPQQMWG